MFSLCSLSFLSSPCSLCVKVEDLSLCSQIEGLSRRPIERTLRIVIERLGQLVARVHDERSTDAGITGWGEAFGYNAIPATRAAIEHMLAPLYVGKDPLQIEALSLEVQQKLHIFGRGGPVIFGLSGIDIALWDIAGKAAGKPVHHLLGGCRAAQLPCYASLIRYTEPKLVAANTTRALDQGFRQGVLQLWPQPEFPRLSLYQEHDPQSL